MASQQTPSTSDPDPVPPPATTAGPPPVARRRRPRLRDRAIVGLARLLTRLFFRSVESEGDVPRHGPVILAASHLNGFVDPVVLAGRLGVFPRYLAKATLWDVAVARPLLGFAGVIPVHRRQDGAEAHANVGTFDSAVAALAAGGVLAVFPEGTTHDDPTIRPLRTGVARIALTAAAAGVSDVTIVPVGVTYQDKVAVRGRALVSFGPPIAVPVDPTIVDADGEPEHVHVRELTDRLQASLEQLTPNFATTEDALALTAAAEITLRPVAGADARPVPMAAVRRATSRLARAEPELLHHLVSLVARYRMLLGFVRLDDDDLTGDLRIRALVRRLVVLGILLVVLAPIALAGLFANLVPVVLVLVAGLVPKAPVTKGTVRFLVAAVAFPATWIVLAMRDGTAGCLGDAARRVTYPVDALLGSDPSDRAGALANVAVVVAAPLLLAVTLLLAERSVAFVRGVVSWRTLVDRRGQLVEVRERRAEVVAATRALLDGPS